MKASISAIGAVPIAIKIALSSDKLELAYASE
jgi:hypothetical protein